MWLVFESCSEESQGAGFGVFPGLERAGAGVKQYTYRTAARLTGRSVREIRRWRAQGMPVRVDPVSYEVLISEDVLFDWWRRMNRRNPVMQHKVRENLQVEDPEGSPLRWPRVEQRPMSTVVVDAPKAWVSWPAAAELASGGGGVDVSVEVLRLANRWMLGRPRPRVLRVSDQQSLVWGPDAALAGAMLPDWALSLDGWASTGLPTLEVCEDELRRHTWPLGAAHE